MVEPNEISPLCSRAIRYHQSGRLTEAEQFYRQAAKETPQAFLPKYLLGALLFQQGRAKAALEPLRAALALHPHAEAFNIQGLVLEMLGRDDEALCSFVDALTLEPSSGEALNNHGNALLRLGQPVEALESFDLAVACEPGLAAPWNNRAAALHRLGRPEDALASVERSLALDAGSAIAWTNRGLALYGLGRLAEAKHSYDRAIACNGDHGDAHWNKGLCLLLEGRFAEGWQLYEWRLRLAASNALRPYRQPRWAGEPLAGKTLYLYAEQGLGDTLQFSRYSSMAAARGARVILSVQDSLFALMRDIGPDVEVRRFNDAPPHFDYHLPLLSVPKEMATELHTIPLPVPFIRPEQERVAAWAERIGTAGFRVGIAWQGKPGGTADAGRSFPLAQLVGLANVSGVRLISLQKGDGTSQLASLPAGMKVETLGDDLDAGPTAFVDTAAALSSLDLIITADTAIAHLGGTMGRPVWLALQHVPDWRWGLAGEATPWYPSMTLFRQPRPGDWAAVFAAMRLRLAAL